MKIIFSALIALSAMTASAATVSTYSNGQTSYVVTTSDEGAVSIARREPCGPGELYPCPGKANPRRPGHPVKPHEPCGGGELYPCPGPSNPPSNGGNPRPHEPCGPGELYPCTAPQSEAAQLDTWFVSHGFSRQDSAE